MNSVKAFLLFSLFLLVLMCFPPLGVGDPVDALQTGERCSELGPNVAGISDARVSAFHDALEADGFIVSEGSAKLVDIFKLVNTHIFDSAGGNNAGQYYKRFQVPPYPGQGEGTKEERDTATFRMKENEAIIYVGPTPPTCDYFSFVPFCFVRYYGEDVPNYNPYSNGNWLFASAGDPLNNMLIKTELKGYSFGEMTMVVFAADAAVYRSIRDTAISAGFPESMINRYVIPSSVLKLGTNEADHPDSLLILVRTSNFRSKIEGDNYLNNDNYATVYRATPANWKKPAKPFDYPAARNRESGPEGGYLNSDLKKGLDRLEAAILAQTKYNKNKGFKVYQSTRWFYDSRDVLKDDPNSPAYRQFVAGESSDTPYLRSSENGQDPSNFTFGKNDMVIVYGVNHTATGLATYSNFGVYGEWKTNKDCKPPYWFGCNDYIWNGVASMTNHDFSGSAEQYIPWDEMAPYLYAVRLVRGECPKRDKYCVSVPTPSSTTVFPADGIGLDQPATIGYRAYLNPITKSGPSYEDIIPDRAIWFRVR